MAGPVDPVDSGSDPSSQTPTFTRGPCRMSDYEDAPSAGAGRSTGTASGGGRSKRCIQCNQLKAYPEFPRNKNRADGHDNRCKRCTARVVAERVARRPLVTEPQVAFKARKDLPIHFDQHARPAAQTVNVHLPRPDGRKC